MTEQDKIAAAEPPLDCRVGREANTQLMELDRKWKHTGDLMVCRVCGYSIIASKAHQRPGHAAGCANYHEKNPWQQLREILVPNAR